MLSEKRQQIDQIDQQIIDLLDQRFALTDAIGQIKKEQQLAVLQNTREQAIYAQIDKQAQNNDDIKQIYQQIMTLSKERQAKI